MAASYSGWIHILLWALRSHENQIGVSAALTFAVVEGTSITDRRKANPIPNLTRYFMGNLCCPHKTRQLGMIESSIMRAEHEGKSLHRRTDYQDFGTGRTGRTDRWCGVSRTRRCRGDILPLAQDICWHERR